VLCYVNWRYIDWFRLGREGGVGEVKEGRNGVLKI
jgi:hypothetical protein